MKLNEYLKELRHIEKKDSKEILKDEVEPHEIKVSVYQADMQPEIPVI